MATDFCYSSLIGLFSHEANQFCFFCYEIVYLMPDHNCRDVSYSLTTILSGLLLSHLVNPYHSIHKEHQDKVL